MTIAWIALWLFSWLKQADPVCSPTSYYRNCWIRRFPGLYIAVEESERRGAALLQLYQEESALQCSRACCLAANFSCNLAVYHYNTTQDSANCFHLHCPTLESCILRQRGNVILYNVTKGVDPDLLVFGKHFTSNYQVLPNHASSRVNISEPFASDKRQFNRPHMVPSSSTHPATPATSTSTSTISPTSEVPVSTTPVSIDYTHNIPPVPSIRRSTLRSPTSPSNPVNQATQGIDNHSPNPTTTTTSTKWASTAPQSTLQPSSVFYTSQKSVTLPSQPPTTATTVSPFSNHPTPGSTNEPMTTTRASTTAPPSSQNTVTSTTEFATSQTTMASAKSQTAWVSTTASTATQTTWASTTASTATQTTWTSTTASTATQTTWASTTASTATQNTWASTTASITSHASSTTFITLTSSNSKALNSKPTTTIPLISTQQNTTDKTSVHSTLAPVQLSSTNAASALTPLTTLKSTTVQPQMASSHTTIYWPYLQPTNTTYSNPAVAGGNTQSPPTDGQLDTSTNITTSSNGIEHSTTSSGPTTSTTPSSSPAASVTTSLTPPTSMEDSQPYPNDTKGYISRNITTGDNSWPGGDGGSTPVWHLAANTVLVALATCATIAFGCCCSVLMAVSWRGRRRRKGRYRTTLRGKSGSMRLIKYVIVRESS
ncbi:mucin-5AC [Pygocentrus nattereri]|uniref:MANSC domain-containing protein n=1 Tax=Pygocentrus nattereri TaxID=42514 RepID=A0A3B4EI92_PYGNA|nr:mucin-5AC [Pygocentrus nattereri]